jgi:hypothetical protein
MFLHSIAAKLLAHPVSQGERVAGANECTTPHRRTQMTQVRNLNSLLSLVVPIPKAVRHCIADTADSSAVDSRERLEERIRWAIENKMDSTADNPAATLNSVIMTEGRDLEKMQVMQAESGEVTNLQFEARINAAIPASARVNACYAKVATVSQTSANGTSHAAVIERCKTFDALRLATKSENPFAPHTVAVFTDSGEQIGYLDSRLTNGGTWNSARWIAIFRRKNRHPETGAVIGATLYMIYLTEPFAREHSRRIAREQQVVPQPSGLEGCVDGACK